MQSIPKQDHILYMGGVGGVMKLGLEKGDYEIDPSRVKVVYARPKLLSVGAMKGIVSRREKHEQARGKLSTNNYLTVTNTPFAKDGNVVIERYVTDFVNWFFTKPRDDEFADSFEGPSDVHHSFFISVYPTTADGKVVIPNRTTARLDYKGDLCFTGGYGREKDITENLLRCEAEMFFDGTGHGLVRQARMIPVDQYGLGPVENVDEYVGEGKLLGITTSSPLIGELGHHIDAMVRLNVESGKIIEQANKRFAKDGYKRFVAIGDLNVFNHNADTLVELANSKTNPVAPTQRQLVWLALAHEFGEEHLGRINGLERIR